MHERYIDLRITKIWSDEHKLSLWQKTELAIIQAESELGLIPAGVFEEIAEILNQHPIDINWWKARDEEIHHDMEAFVEERRRFLPSRLQIYIHRKITSYDTEESAFVHMLKESLELVWEYCNKLMEILKKLAIKHRYTITAGRSHGQIGDLKSLGAQFLDWIADLKRFDLHNLSHAEEFLMDSKISGPFGNYGSFDPRVEKRALEILGFNAFYGATQIMPREAYAPLAQALTQITLSLDKFATFIWQGARSGNPILQEPFGKKQVGSSTMPQKRNPIKSEQQKGMGRIASGCLGSAMQDIVTTENRTIEQSSVERVIWPDLFHTVIRSLKNMEFILSDLQVFADHMLQEIVESRGCYAASEAKEVLKTLGLPVGLTSSEVYLAVQLAASNAFEPSRQERYVRENLPQSLKEADRILEEFLKIPREKPISIQRIILEGRLKISSELEATEEVVARWNKILKRIFEDSENVKIWNEIFKPSYLLKNEAVLYEKILPLDDSDSTSHSRLHFVKLN